uniref:PiggyBac transposable element-derived protein domain-containing protein n=1 Tax=Sipha flava TaxID=143950 RepID=A0A2S2Q203_9HEMI
MEWTIRQQHWKVQNRFHSLKWYMCLFYHLIDMTEVNSWCFYKRFQENKNEVNGIIELAEWRKRLTHSLIKSGQVRHSRRGKPSMSVETKIGSTQSQSFSPTKSVKTDKTDHWPTFIKKERYEMPQYKGFTYVKCTKYYSIHLSFNIIIVLGTIMYNKILK